MSMRVASLRSDRRAAAGAEFALVVPVVLVLMFGIIDAGRFMWELNRAEKATQIGVRMAAVTDPLSPDLIAANFATGTVKAGDLIPASSLGTVLCTSTGCTCETSPCPFSSGTVAAGFSTVLVTRMAQIYPRITAANVQVRYSGSGFGYAGSPPSGGGGPPVAEQMEVSPLITVSLTGLNFDFVSALGLADIMMPPASATLTAEDASGTFSN